LSSIPLFAAAAIDIFAVHRASLSIRCDNFRQKKRPNPGAFFAERKRNGPSIEGIGF